MNRQARGGASTTRRGLLGGVGGALGVTATTGCMGLFSCGPGEVSAEEIAADPDAFGEVTVEGEVSDLNEDGFGITIDDTTGELRIFPTGGYAYDKEVVDDGDCLEIAGEVESEATKESEYDAVIAEEETERS